MSDFEDNHKPDFNIEENPQLHREKVLKPMLT